MTASTEAGPASAPGAPEPSPPSDLRRAMQGALPLWIATRVAIALSVYAATWLVRPPGGRDVPSWLAGWYHWDVALFQKVAEFGYFSPAYTDRTEAFFPGFPMVLRAVHLVVPNWTASGLLVSLVAGAVACVALWRLAEMESGPVAARRAVTYLVLFPYGAFLFAGYSEAIFLAFATTAWLAARKEQWLLAGLLASGAASVRITGVVFGAALAVQYLSQRAAAGPGREPGARAAVRRVLRPELAFLALPIVPVVAYLAYLRTYTGRWDSYQVALREGWGRDTISPITTFTNTLAQATNLDQGADFVWSARVEILSVLLGVVLTVVLLAKCRFGEATFVGLNVGLLSVTTYYGSSVRALMVWFPLYLLLGRLTARRDGLHMVIVAVFAPLLIITSIAFHQGSWLG